MIVYSTTKRGFLTDAANYIEDKIRACVKEKLNIDVKPGSSEYQAWSYATLLYGFNATVYEEKIGLEPCAYLHNTIDQSVIKDSFYKDYLDKAPVFCRGDKEKLQDFIAKYVKYGDKKKTIYRIDNGEIRPSSFRPS